MTSVAVTTANICGNPLRAKRFVRRRMDRALEIVGVTFGQEIARSNAWRTNDYSTMWRRRADRVGKYTYGGPREVPISVPKSSNLLGHETIKVHDGKRHVSPARYINTVRLYLGGHWVAFVNCHPVSKPRKGVPYSRWRINHWNLYHERLEAEVKGLVDDGYTVVFGGDMNKRSVPSVHPRQRTLISSGLDHLWVVPAVDKKVSAVHTSKIGRTVLMDHPILHAGFTLS